MIRKDLDDLLRGYLKALEGIMGREADEVAYGYEGEPLHFRWSGRGESYDFFGVSFHDFDELDVRFLHTSEELRDFMEANGGDPAYDESTHIPVGRTPPAMVRTMKAWRALDEKKEEAL